MKSFCRVKSFHEAKKDEQICSGLIEYDGENLLPANCHRMSL